MGKTGFNYYMAETDRFQDIKVKRLKKRYGCEGYTLYQYTLNEIYRVEGCWLEFTEDELFDVSEYWGIEEVRAKEIINYCAEIGLFDSELWAKRGVLTARSIQSRYLDMCKRSKKKAAIPQEVLLVEQEVNPESAPNPEPSPMPLFAGQPVAGTDAPMPKTVLTPEVVPMPVQPVVESIPESPRKFGNTREASGNVPEKTDKLNERKEKSPSIPPGSSGVPPEREEEQTTSQALERLHLVLKSVGCCKQDWLYVRSIEGVAQVDSPIWQLIEELRSSAGCYSVESYVIPTLRALVQSGRMRIVQIPVDYLAEAKRLLNRIGVPEYEVKKILKVCTNGNEQTLRDAVNTVIRSKGKIVMPALYVMKQLRAQA